MSACFGIHVGNSCICLALNRDNKTEVTANDLGDRVTPATLTFNGTEFEICPSSKTPSRRRPTIRNNKRVINDGITETDIETNNATNDCKIIVSENCINYEVQSDDGVSCLSADQVTNKFFIKMFSIAAHAACKEDELRAVISVPVHWTEDSRQKMSTAAELAGFSVLQVINEPSAAALAYDMGNDNAEDFVLVYRLGGCSCDVTVLRIAGGVYSIEASAHQSDIGGQYITKTLADYMAKEFFQKWKLDPHENKRAMEKLVHYANDCKHILSTLTTSHVFIETLYEGVDWSQNISRARFENLISPLLDAYTAPIRKALSDNGLRERINKILICGGSMKIPKLQSTVSELFPNATVFNNIPPDEVIAIGCAKQAALILEFPDLLIKESCFITDCIEYPIFAKYLDTDVCLFPAGSPIYSEAEVPLKILNNAKDVELCVFEKGEDQKLIGNYNFPITSRDARIHAVLNNDKLIVNIV